MRITRTYGNLRPAHSPPRTMRLARIGFNWQDPPPENLESVDPRDARMLSKPEVLNMHLARRQYPEELLLRHPRLRQTKAPRTGHLSRTHFRPVPMTPQERIRQRAPRTDQQSPEKACILQ